MLALALNSGDGALSDRATIPSTLYFELHSVEMPSLLPAWTAFKNGIDRIVVTVEPLELYPVILSFPWRRFDDYVASLKDCRDVAVNFDNDDDFPVFVKEIETQLKHVVTTRKLRYPGQIPPEKKRDADGQQDEGVEENWSDHVSVSSRGGGEYATLGPEFIHVN